MAMVCTICLTYKRWFSSLVWGRRVGGVCTGARGEVGGCKNVGLGAMFWVIFKMKT